MINRTKTFFRLLSSRKGEVRYYSTSFTKTDKYDEVQGINISAYGGENPMGSIVFEGFLPRIQLYPGPSNHQKDIKIRFDLMKNIVDETLSQDTIQKSSNCLKAFLWPEFYFRPRFGAYTLEEAGELLEMISQHFKRPGYSSCVFVAPFVAFDQSSGAKYSNVFNGAVVIEGGSDGDNLRLVPKPIMSDVDFKSGNFFIPKMLVPRIGLTKEEVLAMDVSSVPMHKMGLTRHHLTNGFVNVGNVNLAVEICLAHRQGHLLSTHKDKLAHIHMTPGAGLARMSEDPNTGDKSIDESFKEENLRLVDGGLAMLTDFATSWNDLSPFQVAKKKTGQVLETLDARTKVKISGGSGVYASDIISAHVYASMKLPKTTL
jgi:hypothetical protein